MLNHQMTDIAEVAKYNLKYRILTHKEQKTKNVQNYIPSKAKMEKFTDSVRRLVSRISRCLDTSS
jgi:hypothetical protein